MRRGGVGARQRGTGRGVREISLRWIARPETERWEAGSSAGCRRWLADALTGMAREALREAVRSAPFWQEPEWLGQQAWAQGPGWHSGMQTTTIARTIANACAA